MRVRAQSYFLFKIIFNLNISQESWPSRRLPFNVASSHLQIRVVSCPFPIAPGQLFNLIHIEQATSTCVHGLARH